ncbi:hypothetical protein ACPPVQ_05885 [Diaminobutyricibacter sp. McL0618]|uniref:hypothetical protein n=1 Tax=Leifsonia sp. McL0618 TaxID=3415677 RepID=UPI003CEA997C
MNEDVVRLNLIVILVTIGASFLVFTVNGLNVGCGHQDSCDAFSKFLFLAALGPPVVTIVAAIVSSLVHRNRRRVVGIGIVSALGVLIAGVIGLEMTS